MKPKNRKTADTPVRALAEALVPVSFVTTAMLSRIGAEHDLSLTLVRVLGILRDRRLRMVDLAAYLGLEKQTLSGLIARAEARGLVARAPNPEDGRATDVYLAPEGHALVESMNARMLEQLEPITASLSAEELRQLRELLERLLDAHGS